MDFLKIFAENPDFGAVFTYHLSKSYPTMKEKRVKLEKELTKKGQSIPKINWDAIDAEGKDEGTKIWIVIKDENGNIINKVKGPNKKGINLNKEDPSNSEIQPKVTNVPQSAGWADVEDKSKIDNLPILAFGIMTPNSDVNSDTLLPYFRKIPLE